MSNFIGLYYRPEQWVQARQQYAENEALQTAFTQLSQQNAAPLHPLLQAATLARWQEDAAQAQAIYTEWLKLDAQGIWQAENEADWLDLWCTLAQVDALADFSAVHAKPLRAALLAHVPAVAHKLQDGLNAWQASIGKAAFISIPDAEALTLSLRWMHLGACLAALGADDLLDPVQALYQQVIDQHVHPEGYLRPLVENKQAGTFERLYEGIRALALTAIVAQGAGRDLWRYENRGVAVTTAVAYMVYYYFYPEKWRWEAQLDAEQVKARYHQRGAYFDLTNARTILRNMAPLLAELRPCCDLTGGGYATLLCASKAPTPAKKGWRLFG